MRAAGRWGGTVCATVPVASVTSVEVTAAEAWARSLLFVQNVTSIPHSAYVCRRRSSLICVNRQCSALGLLKFWRRDTLLECPMQHSLRAQEEASANGPA